MCNPSSSGRATSRREWLWDRAAIHQRAIELRSGVARILDTGIVPHGGAMAPKVLIGMSELNVAGDVRSTWKALLPSADTRGLARLELTWSNASLALAFDLGNQDHRQCLRNIRCAGLLALATDRHQTSCVLVEGLADTTLAQIVTGLAQNKRGKR